MQRARLGKSLLMILAMVLAVACACQPDSEEKAAHGFEAAGHADRAVHQDEDDDHDDHGDPDRHSSTSGSHDGHDGDEGEEHGEEHSGVLALTPELMAEHGIELAVAGPGFLQRTAELPGEVHLNNDRVAHVTPWVGGVVQAVFKSLGDQVAAGELLAVIESRELADAKAAFQAAHERVKLAEATFNREERLWQERVTAEQDLLDAGNSLAEAQIELRLARHRLRTLGIGDDELALLATRPDSDLTSYRLTAPLAGVVIDRHLTLGETVAADATVLTVADLATVWIDLQVYQRDLGSVRPGQPARVVTNHGSEADLTIDVVQPLVGEETRTALARIVTDNSSGMWHPGCFVTAHVTVAEAEVPVRLPRFAIVHLEQGTDMVFVEDEHGLELRPISIGRQDRQAVEVVQGLSPGEHYVARGAFTLKAELLKSSFSGHGHAH